MKNTETTGNCTAELLLNASSPAIWKQQQTAIDQLEELVADGVLEEYEVTIWGREVSLSGPLQGTDFHRETLEKIRELEDWSVDHPETCVDFERREVSFEMTGDSCEVVRTPSLCLALYDGEGRLSEVYPQEEPSGVCTVHGALERLRSARAAGSLRDAVRGTP